MKIKLAKSHFNWLWKLAILFYCQFLFCQLFFEKSNNYHIKYGDSNIASPFIYLIIFILIPPFIEEIIYRGVCIKKKITMVYAIIFYIGSTAMLFNTGIKIWWVFIILTPLIILFATKRNTNDSKAFIIIYSTLLFTLAHFSPMTTIQEIVQEGGNYLSAGFFLSWVAINYNILKSILVHLIYNTIVLSFFITFSNKKFIDSENGNIKYKIEEISLFDKSKSITRKSNSLVAKQANLSVVLSHLIIPKEYNIYVESPISKFNINIYDKIDNLEDEEILDILIQAEIIQLR